MNKNLTKDFLNVLKYIKKRSSIIHLKGKKTEGKGKYRYKQLCKNKIHYSALLPVSKPQIYHTH